MTVSLSGKGNGKLLFMFLAVSALLCAVIFVLLARFKPVFEEKAAHAAGVRATAVLNEAINSVFAEASPAEFVDIAKNADGKIAYVSVKTAEMNKLKAALALNIQSRLKGEEVSTIFVPMGSLTGYPVLQGIGYRIPVKISFDGISKVDFDDAFTESGINQVKHKIYLTASAEFSVISAMMTQSKQVSTEIPVAETVIVGEVPEYYGDNLSVVGR